MVQSFLAVVLFLLSFILIGLILIQRGRGGGLAGAFGGMGGQSAFGTKAGDVFTRFTVVVVSIWFIVCCTLLVTLKQGETIRSGFGEGNPPAPASTGTDNAKTNADGAAESSAPTTAPTPAEGAAPTVSAAPEPEKTPSPRTSEPADPPAAPATAEPEKNP